MPLAPGSRLGPYEVLSQIGEGGMGIVFKAKDVRLGREVAIKVMPAAFADDPERLRRFELEAKAVGRMTHPNILAVHDTGTHEGMPYLVMELLEGETLRERLTGKPLSAKKAVDITLQIAHGLEAAHAQGIIHRDLKPENIFITRDGRVKILDFGLAKSTDQVRVDGMTEALTPAGSSRAQGTAVGTIMGTVGYMSPEQVRGEKLDGRSDLFCLGLILWEMLTGSRPFLRPSSIETMHAILREELPDLGVDLKLPPLLERVLHSCLAKDPAGRFHSAHDLAFALEASTLSGSASYPRLKSEATALPRTTRSIRAALAGGALLLLGGAAWFLSGRSTPSNPSFRRITFAPGLVDSAFFSADGRSIYFCARFQGQKPGIFVSTPESPEPRPLDTQSVVLTGVSRSNDLAVLRDATSSGDGTFRGTLAQMPGGGGATRDLLENVDEASWDMPGKGLAAITRDKTFTCHLEWPLGRELRSSIGNLKLVRMSIPADRVAVVDGTSESGDVVVFDAKGTAKVLMSKKGDAFAITITGLAWHPDGKEVWVSEIQGDQTVLWALNLRGRRRMVWRTPGSMRLMDIAPDGRVLVTMVQSRRGVFLQQPGKSSPRDLSILDGTQAVAFLPNGRTLLLFESPTPDGGTAQDAAFLREIDGRPALRLGMGLPRSLSADGKYVGLTTNDTAPEAAQNALSFIPTGAGLPITVPLPSSFVGIDDPLLFDGGRKIVFAGIEKDRDWRFYVMDRQGGLPRAFTPVGTRAPRPLLLSPDLTRMIATTSRVGGYDFFPLAGGEPRPIPGVEPEESPIAWTQEGIYVTSEPSALPMRLTRLDPVTGRRQPVTTFMPPDTAGYLGTTSVCMAPGAASFAYTYSRKTSDLFIVEGLR